MAYRIETVLAAVSLFGAVATGGKFYVDSTVRDASEIQVRRGLEPVMLILDEMKLDMDAIAEGQKKANSNLNYIRGRVDANSETLISERKRG